MTTIASSHVQIQTLPQSVPSIPSWFGEVTVISHYLRHLGVLSEISERVHFAQRRYGNGAIVVDLAGLSYVMRGKDYDLLDLESVHARLTQPPDQQTSHPETGTCRALFDFPDLSLSPAGPRLRVIVATHPATETSAKIGVTRGEVVYELFSTALPQGAFTPADVVDLYLHRGKRDESASSIGLSLHLHRFQVSHHLHLGHLHLLQPLTLCPGETGNGVFIGGSW